MNYILEAAQKCGADGIDFPITKGDNEKVKIYFTYTIEDFKNAEYFPKSPYLFWKMIDGQKVYIEQTNK